MKKSSRRLITWGEFKKKMEREGRRDDYKLLISDHMNEREFQKLAKKEGAR